MTQATSDPQSQIPIIDFSPFSNGTPQERLSIARTLTAACRNYGFVYIINHGLGSELLDEAFGWSKKFFDLNVEEKMLAPHPEGPEVHRGYSRVGMEKVSQVFSKDEGEDIVDTLRQVRDCKESFEFGAPQNKSQPNIHLPPNVLPGFQQFLESFYWNCHSISQQLLSALSIGLNLPDPNFLGKFHTINNQLRILHYPPIPAAEIERGEAARMPAHSDWGSITLLFQDDCGGLEIENPHSPGTFISAPPMKNALIMNIGDLLQRWSNDQLKSTLHRVTLPPLDDRFTGSERITRARYSIPYFVSPDVETLVECLPACMDEKNPARYEPVIQDDYRRMRAGVQYVEAS